MEGDKCQLVWRRGPCNRCAEGEKGLELFMLGAVFILKYRKPKKKNINICPLWVVNTKMFISLCAYLYYLNFKIKKGHPLGWLESKDK